MMKKISAIVMASGMSSRMGKNKLFLMYQGRTFLERTLSLLISANLYEIILVITPKDLKQIKIPKQVKVVINEKNELGQSESVKLGTMSASGEGYLFVPIDQPSLSAVLIEQLVEQGDFNRIVFPINNGVHQSPVLFGEKFRKELLEVSGYSGGKQVKNRHKKAWLPVTIEGDELFDVDTPEDYLKLLKRSGKTCRK